MDTFACPICFETYSQEIKPMIVCQEGHSICELCLKGIDSCPFCRTTLDNFNPIRNRDLLKAAEEIQKQPNTQNAPIIPLSQLDIAKEAFAFGGSADIFKAKWGNTQVVVKKLRFQSDEKQQKQFQNELNLAVKLNHQNTIKVYGMVQFENQFGIVMEFAEQGNLAQKIPNLTYEEQINYSLQIIQGIKYLHHNLIIHRDLKPENILISNNQPKITDFGISKVHDHTMKNTTAAFSFGYSAPELYQQGSAYDTSCDIFSLSMILYEIFAKKKGFENGNLMMIAMKMMQGERPEFPNDFPKDLAEVIKKGWKQNPKERCSLDEFTQCLERMKPENTNQRYKHRHKKSHKSKSNQNPNQFSQQFSNLNINKVDIEKELKILGDEFNKSDYKKETKKGATLLHYFAQKKPINKDLFNHFIKSGVDWNKKDIYFLCYNLFSLNFSFFFEFVFIFIFEFVFIFRIILVIYLINFILIIEFDIEFDFLHYFSFSIHLSYIIFYFPLTINYDIISNIF
ncbi:palmitoyltransferase [Anaeramoeba ignava]|uniref:Palmitoyltransferase n=1 Tax=Anaeramoeba ignava TaxID=1746090 RepID=A0A9Q0RGY8_ANAIG|nr:palmitoyltransferase [Anaeramoeba ignava]